MSVTNAPSPIMGFTKFMSVELAITLVINLIMGTLATWRLSDPAPLTSGSWAAAFDEMAHSTIPPTLMFVLGYTAALRRRATIQPLPFAPWPFAWHLPHNILLRTAAMIPINLLGLALPFTFLLQAIERANPLTMPGLLEFKLLYSLAFTLVVTPIVILAAIDDAARNRK